MEFLPKCLVGVFSISNLTSCLSHLTPTWLFKTFYGSFKGELLNIMDLSRRTGTFPAAYKTAVVRPPSWKKYSSMFSDTFNKCCWCTTSFSKDSFSQSGTIFLTGSQKENPWVWTHAPQSSVTASALRVSFTYLYEWVTLSCSKATTWLYFKLNDAELPQYIHSSPKFPSLHQMLSSTFPQSPRWQQSPDTNKSAVIPPLLVQILELVTSNLITLINLADITARLKPFRQVYWFWRRHIPSPCG